MAKVEPKSETQIFDRDVAASVQQLARASNRTQILNALRKLRRLMEKTPEGANIDVEGLDRAFRMKQSRASGVWDRDVSGLVGRIMDLARAKSRK